MKFSTPLASLILSALTLDAIARPALSALGRRLSALPIGCETSSPEYFFKQKLDHNDPTSTATWRQRYFLNEGFKEGDDYPVFLYLGGSSVNNETSHDPTMFMHDLALVHNAMVVAVEARYMGKFTPTVKKLTTENLRFLSPEQAISDLVAIKRFLVKNKTMTSNNRWVLFGGCVFGSWVTWAKMMYPDEFVGAVVSTAPLKFYYDFYEHFDKVAQALEYHGGKDCLNNVGAALNDFHRLVSSTSGTDKAKFKRLFNACKILQNDMDRGEAEDWLSGTLCGIAEWDPSYSSTYTLKNVCQDFDGTTAENRLTILASIFRQENDYGECIGYDYQKDWIDYLKDETVSEDTWRQLKYLDCTGYDGGKNTASATSIFNVLKYHDLNHGRLDVCKVLFGITDVEARVAAVNQKYGGFAINVSNVIFVNGDLSPNSPMTLTKEVEVVNPSSKVVNIPGVASMRDMWTMDMDDTVHLVSAHQKIAAFVNNLLK